MLETSNLAITSRATDELTAQIDACRVFPATVQVPAEDLDPWAWLDAQPHDVKLAWSQRGDDGVLVGAGEACHIMSSSRSGYSDVLSECRARLKSNRQIRFYGGFSFDGDSAWDEFGAVRLFVPRLTLADGQLQVTIMDSGDAERAKRAVRRMRFQDTWDAPLPTRTGTSYSPNRNQWQSNLDEALSLIRSEVLEKIVLARKATLQFDQPINPVSLTARIAEATFDCFVFCFQFRAGRAFVGATPERLFKRDGQRLLSEVVAGTRPRGITPGEDQRLAYELLTSDKDQLEHDIVRKSMRQKLHKCVDQLDVDSHASVLRLARKQHLCSEVQATLKAGIDEGVLLERLHPTPAVGGYPTENALPELTRLEPFNRGWYAAPIGWIGADDAEFAVGIRSALVEENELSLYSGAGIVSGSDPDQEWNEVDNKIQEFIELLG